ncbi:hypothetical protein M408DRAFT_328343 [Serendipita vermifera MAFF 305830]|uniref:Uncharacterized protein n=1 Tax=Serendipita vermifera MAFF 305830 TaxID=933852 RepID=A0A0C3B0N9_SERVB|nr:hypothetical protein M408DRAFT_328343 [Serendipita vermifera MAFF 305830]
MAVCSTLSTLELLSIQRLVTRFVSLLSFCQPNQLDGLVDEHLVCLNLDFADFSSQDERSTAISITGQLHLL